MDSKAWRILGNNCLAVLRLCELKILSVHFVSCIHSNSVLASAAGLGIFYCLYCDQITSDKIMMKVKITLALSCEGSVVFQSETIIQCLLVSETKAKCSGPPMSEKSAAWCTICKGTFKHLAQPEACPVHIPTMTLVTLFKLKSNVRWLKLPLHWKSIPETCLW